MRTGSCWRLKNANPRSCASNTISWVSRGYARTNSIRLWHSLRCATLAAERLRAEGLHTRAKTLDGLRAKTSALMTARARARVEPDLEALLEAEGHAMRPGPHPSIPDAV